MSYETNSKHKTPNVIGKCATCKNVIFDDELFVDLEHSIYHFSCHNRKVQKENEKANE